MFTPGGAIEDVRIADLLLHSLDSSSHIMTSQQAGLSTSRRRADPDPGLDLPQDRRAARPSRRDTVHLKDQAKPRIIGGQGCLCSSPRACARGTTTGYGFVTGDQWKTAPRALGSTNNEC